MKSLILSGVVALATAATASAWESDDYGFPLESSARPFTGSSFASGSSSAVATFTPRYASNPAYSPRVVTTRPAPVLRTFVTRPAPVLREITRPARLVLRPGFLVR